MNADERGLIHGLAIAASYMAGMRDEPTYAGEIITEHGYCWADLKRAKVDGCDLKVLRPILCKRRATGEQPQGGAEEGKA